MSLSTRILNIWNLSPYKAPSVPLIFFDNEYMLTVDDSENFLRFMSLGGEIFFALHSKCELRRPPSNIGESVYICEKLDPILCSPGEGPGSDRDRFVLNNIIPAL